MRIQALAECTHALFDKTGTLTEATLSLGDVRTFDGVSHDAGVAPGRDARAPEPPPGGARHCGRASRPSTAAAVRDVATHAGAGVSATIDGRTLRLGRSDFALAASRWRASSRTPCCLPTTADRSPPFASRERLRPRGLRRDRRVAGAGHDSAHRQRRRRVRKSPPSPRD